jgi:uncharacterized membrane protein YuzA (DUF378 family)
MKKNYLIKTLDLIIALLVMVALVNWGTVYWFNFNIVEWITFGVGWLAGTIYTIVSIVGSIWLISSVARLLMK